MKRSFEVDDGDTRFLGDLYQELSERAKKKYALLQTPVFVEEFILDRTLTPAIDEFGLEKVRMIDPTCGSGHFLLGGFARLFDLWSQAENNEQCKKDAQKALDGVWGVDINPFAVAIARFRLIVAAVQACGIKRLKQAPGWKIHLATGDSLLFGSRWNRFGGERDGTSDGWRLTRKVGRPRFMRAKTKRDLRIAVASSTTWSLEIRHTSLCGSRTRTQLIENDTALVIRNTRSPYRSPSDSLNCVHHRQRCEPVHRSDTANSFMKREFGKKLIEEFFPRIDLTHVIDTSGAYIPGHGTPTVILFGRNRKPRRRRRASRAGDQRGSRARLKTHRRAVWQSIVNKSTGLGPGRVHFYC